MSKRELATDLEIFTAAVLQALYFTDTGGDSEHPTGTEITEECRLDLEADCRSFWHRFGCYILAEQSNPGLAQAGHDFWYTRNGHGCGYWDGDWPQYGDLLTDGAKLYGEFDPVFEGDA